MPRPTNALIVDDEPHVRAFAKLLLRQLGITTIWEAPDGLQALPLIEEHQPQLIMLDLNMPQMGGMDVLRELQTAGYDTPVVVLTSESAVKTVQEAASLGAVGYILKHSRPDEAKESLRELLDAIEKGEAGEESEEPAPGA